jgi:hypothetical protein
MQNRILIALVFGLALLPRLSASDSGLVIENIRVLNQPFNVMLQLNRVSAFVMPAVIQSTRLPTAYIKNFNVEVDPGSNILYISPKKEMKTPCTLFIVVDEAPFEFNLTANTAGDYQHQIIVGEPLCEVTKRNELEAIRKRFEMEKLNQKQAVENFISLLSKAKKMKQNNRTIYMKGPLTVRLQAQFGDYYLLQTNVPEQAFSKSSKSYWLFLEASDHNYVLTSAKKFQVLDKEVKL